MNFKLIFITLISLFISTHCLAMDINNGPIVKSVDDLEWGYLNPLRGDQSPGAADLWGDRTQSAATGMLVKFREGFSSPPHIHNITYRGIVIKGLLHNDDPGAEKMWLPKTSVWTQPAGETHITAAGATENMAYIEIDSGPYLVKPESEAFDNGEKPINVTSSNLVWIEASELNWANAINTESNSAQPQVALLWRQNGLNNLNGSMLKLPPGFKGKIVNPGGLLRALVIQGELTHKGPKKSKELKPGSYFESNGAYKHIISAAQNNEETIIYLRSSGNYKLSH